jgi:deoxycytidylate deaminase
MIVSTLRPCNNCLKHIRASGIRKAYYIWHREGNEFNDCDIIASDMTLRQFKPDINKLLSEIEQEHIVKPLVKGCK